MPLIKSAAKKNIGKNIDIEEEAGKPKKQAVAIALNTARNAEPSDKGHLAKYMKRKKLQEKCP